MRPSGEKDTHVTPSRAVGRTVTIEDGTALGSSTAALRAIGSSGAFVVLTVISSPLVGDFDSDSILSAAIRAASSVARTAALPWALSSGTTTSVGRRRAIGGRPSIGCKFSSFDDSLNGCCGVLGRPAVLGEGGGGSNAYVMAPSVCSVKNRVDGTMQPKREIRRVEWTVFLSATLS